MARAERLLLDEPTRQRVGHCLRVLRNRAELSQVDAAGRFGIAAGSLCDIEQGRREPSLRLIHLAAVEYKVHPNVILGVVFRQEFYFPELDPGGYLFYEAGGSVRAQDILSPDERQKIRQVLEDLGYTRLP